MKRNILTAAVRGTACILSLLLCGSYPAAAGNPVDGSGTPAQTEITVNDGEMGTGLFQFEFSAGWVHEGGYPARFVGGDEHWSTTATSGAALPSLTFRFSGTKVSLYGHKVPAGGMAHVTIDGADAGVVDFYNAVRIEKTLLFESGILDNGDHTLKLQMLNDRNPSAGDTREAGIDYAVVLTDRTVPVSQVKADVRSLLLEPGMHCTLSWTFLPEYATEIPEVRLISSDEEVLKIGGDGTLHALKAGKATVTIEADNGRCQDTVLVTVREPVGGDLSGMAGTTDRHTRQDTYPDRFADWNPEKTSLSAVAWRDDVASVKLDLMTKGKDITNVRVAVGELTDESGNSLRADAAAYFIRNTNAHDTGHDIPDVLYTQEASDIPAGSLASVWVKIQTAADALPGIYTGDITATADGGITLTFPLTVEVIGLVAPANTAELELWQYPYSSNRYYSGKTTEEYFGSGVEGLWATHLDPQYEAGLVSQIRLYAAAGGRSVTTTIVEDPWNSQTPDPYPSMIKWTRGADGKFSFDYSDFLYWVSLNQENGVDGRILAFSISDWANRVTYMDEARGRVVTEELTPGSNRWKQIWGEFLRDFMEYTTSVGIFERVYLAMDERSADVVENVLDLVESVRNDKGECFRTALAVFTFDAEYLFDRVTDLSLAIYMDAAKLDKLTAHRRKLGLTTTLYTCGAQYSALENQPIESLYTMWYCEKRGADGFLRWALDAFNADPLRSSAHRLFAAGDIYLFYPDERDGNMTAKSSPRFEKLAEGCRDLSKYRYLLAIAPAMFGDIQRQVQRLEGRNMELEVKRIQDALNHAARYAALSEYCVAAGQVSQPDAELLSALSSAQSVLQDPDATDAVLRDATVRLAGMLVKETQDATETDFTTSADAASDAGTTGPVSGADTTDSGAQSSGCSSSLSGAAVAGIVAAATAVTVRRKRRTPDPDTDEREGRT